MRGLSPVAASGGHSSLRCAGLSLSWPLLLRSTGSRRAGSAVVAHEPSCSAACGIFPDQGSNPRPLHWQADSQPLRHQGSPKLNLITPLLNMFQGFIFFNNWNNFCGIKNYHRFVLNCSRNWTLYWLRNEANFSDENTSALRKIVSIVIIALTYMYIWLPSISFMAKFFLNFKLKLLNQAVCSHLSVLPYSLLALFLG